jgi:S-phase kinase-associated protein 1
MITLCSRENEKFRVARKVAEFSKHITNMLEEDDGEECSLPLPNVGSAALTRVVAYCEYHMVSPANEISKPLKENLEDVVCKWDIEFLKMGNKELTELISAANYLDIPGLLDLTCAKVATMIRGKKPCEVREMFNIENDFTPEEEKKIDEENKWCVN